MTEDTGTGTNATPEDALEIAQTALATTADVERGLTTLQARTGWLDAEVALLEEQLDRTGR